MNVKIKRLYKEASLPTKGSEKAAAYDVYACITNDTGLVTIEPHTTVKIGTGLSMAPPEGFFVGVYARSGLSSKEGLRPANCVGVCDEDYRGEIRCAVGESRQPRADASSAQDKAVYVCRVLAAIQTDTNRHRKEHKEHTEFDTQVHRYFLLILFFPVSAGWE